MKIKITKPDGTIVEAEGTPEECATFAGFTSRWATPVYPVPTYIPAPFGPQPWDLISGPTWTSGYVAITPDEIARGVAAGNITYTSTS